MQDSLSMAGFLHPYPILGVSAPRPLLYRSLFLNNTSRSPLRRWRTGLVLAWV